MEGSIKNTARQILAEYLQKNGYKKTPERYAMLDAAYSLEEPFDILMLYTYMETDVRFHVCKATLYNNIVLLLKAGLISRCQSRPCCMYKRTFS